MGLTGCGDGGDDDGGGNTGSSLSSGSTETVDVYLKNVNWNVYAYMANITLGQATQNIAEDDSGFYILIGNMIFHAAGKEDVFTPWPFLSYRAGELHPVQSFGINRLECLTEISQQF